VAKVKIQYLRALVVDDSGVARKMTQEMLKDLGFKHIDEAENANDAHDKMDALKYDIVFLDWMMPGRSGISLMGEWRQDPRYDDVAVIVISMQEHQGLIAGALQAGALGYIVKPASIDKLTQAVEKALRWLEIRREAREDKND
jgi:two-component system chemotaxis response regulator CheY